MAVKCNLISIGEINRYIFLIFIGAILEMCFSFIAGYSKFIQEENISLIISIIIYPLGHILSFIFLIIHKIYNKKKERKYITTNKPRKKAANTNK